MIKFWVENEESICNQVNYSKSNTNAICDITVGSLC